MPTLATKKKTRRRSSTAYRHLWLVPFTFERPRTKQRGSFQMVVEAATPDDAMKRCHQAMLGHASLNTTALYTHVAIRALKEVHERTHPGAKLGKREPKTSKNGAVEVETAELLAMLEAEQTEEVERSGAVSTFDEDYFYTRDHLGSVRDVVESDGTTIASRVSYDSWGKVSETGTGPLTDFAFTGHHFDRLTGLGLTWYRGYDARLGRWLSKDPIGFEGGLNSYGYAVNAPTGYVDRNGDVAVAAAAAAGGTVAAAAGASLAIWGGGFGFRDESLSWG